MTLEERIEKLEKEVVALKTKKVMVRPDWSELNSNVAGLVSCSCGSMLHYRHELRDHWQSGHFDYQAEIKQ